MRSFHLKRVFGLVVAILVSGVWILFSQTAPGTGLDSAGLVQYLNQTIGWYRQLDLQRQMVTDPDEGMVVNDNEQIANQVVSLAFEFARAEAESIEKEEASGGGRDGAGASHSQALRQMLTSLDQQVRANQVELDSLRQKLVNEAGRQRESLQTRIDEVRSELELAQVRRDALRSMAEFIGGSSASGFGATGIREKIEALARSVPAALAKPATKPETSATANERIYPATAPGTRKSQPSGVWGLALDVIDFSKRMRTIRDAIQLTDSLNQDLKGLRTPLVNTLRELSKRGDELAGQADTSDQIVLV